MNPLALTTGIRRTSLLVYFPCHRPPSLPSFPRPSRSLRSLQIPRAEPNPGSSKSPTESIAYLRKLYFSYTTSSTGILAKKWNWIESDDALKAHGFLFLALLLGSVPALYDLRLSQIPYFLSLATISIYIGSHHSLDLEPAETISFQQVRSTTPTKNSSVLVEPSRPHIRIDGPLYSLPGYQIYTWIEPPGSGERSLRIRWDCHSNQTLISDVSENPRLVECTVDIAQMARRRFRRKPRGHRLGSSPRLLYCVELHCR